MASTAPAITRRTALKGLALAGLAPAVRTPLAASEQESSDKSELGLVVYNCAIRRKWMQQQAAPFDLFEPLTFLQHCQKLGAGGMQAPLGVLDSDHVRTLRDYAERHELFVEAIIQPPKSESDASRFEAEVRTAAEVGAQAARTVRRCVSTATASCSATFRWDKGAWI